MKVSLFDYELPREFIAQVPADPRDSAKLLVLDRASGHVEHRVFRDLPDYLVPGDLLVLNDTKVIPARVYGLRRTGGKVEVLFLERVRERTYEALVGSGGKIRVGETLKLADGAIEVEVVSKTDEGVFTLEVLKPDNLLAALEAHGHMPTPPYISRNGDQASLETLDRSRYQTVFAANPGAVAAPTAGLHFTPQLLDRVRENDTEVTSVTLHVGLGTFRPVKVDNVEEHTMHSEHFEVSPPAAAALDAARLDSRRVIAIGTTTSRVLESLPDGPVSPHTASTGIFIFPPYRFRRVGAMITNFHLPRSTLLMMVSAFASREMIMDAYEVAKRDGYRFYSYGDAMLIL